MGTGTARPFLQLSYPDLVLSASVLCVSSNLNCSLCARRASGCKHYCSYLFHKRVSGLPLSTSPVCLSPPYKAFIGCGMKTSTTVAVPFLVCHRWSTSWISCGKRHGSHRHCQGQGPRCHPQTTQGGGEGRGGEGRGKGGMI